MALYRLAQTELWSQGQATVLPPALHALAGYQVRQISAAAWLLLLEFVMQTLAGRA